MRSSIVDVHALDFRDFISEGDTVHWGIGAGEPPALTRLFWEQSPHLKSVSVLLNVGFGSVPALPPANVRVRSFGAAGRPGAS